MKLEATPTSECNNTELKSGYIIDKLFSPSSTLRNIPIYSSDANKQVTGWNFIMCSMVVCWKRSTVIGYYSNILQNEHEKLYLMQLLVWRHMTFLSQSCQNTPSAFFLESEMLQPRVHGHKEYKRKHSSKDLVGLKHTILCHLWAKKCVMKVVWN